MLAVVMGKLMQFPLEIAWISKTLSCFYLSKYFPDCVKASLQLWCGDLPRRMFLFHFWSIVWFPSYTLEKILFLFFCVLIF